VGHVAYINHDTEESCGYYLCKQEGDEIDQQDIYQLREWFR
jgi:hypothetical protein